MFRMTRFQQEISGSLGEYWQKSAMQKLEDLHRDVEEGRIVIDSNGVARNCIGRAVMSDLLERLTYLKLPELNVEATKVAREREVEESIAEYVRNYTGPSAEELAEMRAAFGPGTKVVNLFTGDRIVV